LITGLNSRGAFDSKVESAKTLRSGNLQKLKQSTIETRKLRGQGKKPLIASSGLLNSLKSDKGKLTLRKYGVYQEEGFTTQNNPIIEGVQFFFKGKAIPGRKWIFRDFTKKNIDKFFSDFHKALKK